MISLLNKTVENKNHDKPILTDVFYKKTCKKKPIVIFCHGYKGYKDWGAWNLAVSDFVKNNLFFVKFNFSHNGGTAEQPIDFPDLEAFGNNNYTKELDDLESVINWISNNTDFRNEAKKEDISLIGHSRGGGIVILKSKEDARVKQVITLASVCDFEQRTATIGDLKEWKKEGVKYVVNGRTKQNMPHFYQFYENFIQNKERLDIKKATENLEIPYLIIHGNKDTSVLIEEAKNLKKWNPDSELKVLEKADHSFGTRHPWKAKNLPKDLKKVVESSLSFLNKLTL